LLGRSYQVTNMNYNTLSIQYCYGWDPRKKEQRCGYADAQLSPQRAKGS